MIDSEIIEERGRELAHALLGAVRTLETHGPDNQAFLLALARLSAVLERDRQELGDGLRLDVIDRRLLLNGTRLRAHGAARDQLEQLVEVFGARRLGGLAVTGVVDPELLRRWLARFVSVPRTEDEVDALHTALAEFAPGVIHALPQRTLTTPEHEETVRVSTMAFAMQTYARVLLAYRDFVVARHERRDPYANRLSVVRVVQDLIDVVAARGDLLVQVVHLAITRELGRPYEEVHAANTAVYALLIGHVLQLDRTTLLDVGTGALVAGALMDRRDADPAHDPEVPWTDGERAAYRAEVTRTLHGELDLDGLDDALMIHTIVACEQDMPARAGPHALSRIVTIASTFDALTQRRQWRDGHAPEQALRIMLREPEGHFDPTILMALECVLTAYLGVRA